MGKRASQAVLDALGGSSRTRIDRSIIVDLKSVKNATELDGFRAAHVRDGAALASYFAWLEEALARGADELEACRRKLEHFRGLSFTTISSTGPNGAIIHYSPDPQSCPDIDPKQMYLWCVCCGSVSYLLLTRPDAATRAASSPMARRT